MRHLLSADAEAYLRELIDQRIAEKLTEFEQRLPSASPWLTVDGAADYVHTSEGRAIRKRMERRQLPYYRPEGSPIMLNRDEIDATYRRSRVEVL